MARRGTAADFLHGDIIIAPRGAIPRYLPQQNEELPPHNTFQ